MEEVQKFIRAVADQEEANGSTQVAIKLRGLADQVGPNHTMEDVAVDFYDIYDDYIDGRG